MLGMIDIFSFEANQRLFKNPEVTAPTAAVTKNIEASVMMK